MSGALHTAAGSVTMGTRIAVIFVFGALAAGLAQAEIAPSAAVVYFDFGKGTGDLAKPGRGLRLNGAKWGQTGDPMQKQLGVTLQFSNPAQFAEMEFSRSLDGIEAMTVGGWFYCKRVGEQYLFSRGLPEIEVGGERRFRRKEDWVNFVLGTDQRGFFLGTINGNGGSVDPRVTVNELPIETWNQLVVVKTADGYQKFYQNGTLIHTDRNANLAPRKWPFHDLAPGEPLRLSMPAGGYMGEVWIFAREIGRDEIRQDYLAKKDHYKPAFPGEPVLLRTMDERHAAGLWKEPIDLQHWPQTCKRIMAGVSKIFGEAPSEKVPLAPKVISDEDMGTYIRRKVSIQVQDGDRMPMYLLIPKNRRGPVPAIICFYGTTGGAGKETTVGLSGGRPGSPPDKNRGFAVTMVNAGFVAVAADYLRDGERISPGRRPYDTTDFYREFPNWSIHGKDAWDTSRAIDYLETLDFVDAGKIGMTGHSYGGHSTIFRPRERDQSGVSNGQFPTSSTTG